jgi:hypothetical protein
LGIACLIERNYIYGMGRQKDQLVRHIHQYVEARNEGADAVLLIQTLHFLPHLRRLASSDPGLYQQNLDALGPYKEEVLTHL